jgi:hypothetical protein
MEALSALAGRLRFNSSQARTLAHAPPLNANPLSDWSRALATTASSRHSSAHAGEKNQESATGDKVERGSERGRAAAVGSAAQQLPTNARHFEPKEREPFENFWEPS